MPKAKKTTAKKTATKATQGKVKAPTPTTKKKIIVKEVTPVDAVPHTAIIGAGVLLECEPGYIRTVDGSGLTNLLKEVNVALDKLTDGRVSVTDSGTWAVDRVDTCERKEKLWY